MRLTRWLPTFLAFPAAGLITIETVGSFDGAASGAVAGLLAGAVIGAGQWLALRSAGIGRGWIAATAGGLAAAMALAGLVTGAGTETADVVVTGLLAGGAVGAAQATQFGRGTIAAAGKAGAAGAGAVAAWTLASAAAWALGWLVTAEVIVDLDRGYVVFGSSGALTATLLTGLVLRRLLPAPALRAAVAA